MLEIKIDLVAAVRLREVSRRIVVPREVRVQMNILQRGRRSEVQGLVPEGEVAGNTRLLHVAVRGKKLRPDFLQRDARYGVLADIAAAVLPILCRARIRDVRSGVDARVQVREEMRVVVADAGIDGGGVVAEPRHIDTHALR